jgi:hypothetical protein
MRAMSARSSSSTMSRLPGSIVAPTTSCGTWQIVGKETDRKSSAHVHAHETHGTNCQHGHEKPIQYRAFLKVTVARLPLATTIRRLARVVTAFHPEKSFHAERAFHKIPKKNRTHRQAFLADQLPKCSHNGKEN